MIRLLNTFTSKIYNRRYRHLTMLVFSTLLLGAAPAACPNVGLKCPSGAECLVTSRVMATGYVATEECDIGNGGLGGDHLEVPLNEGIVGYDHFVRGDRPGARGECDKIVYFYRTGYLFSTSVLKDFVEKRGLARASFRFVVPSSLVTKTSGQPKPLGYNYSCVDRIGTANRGWINDDPADNVPIPSHLLQTYPFKQPAPFNNQITKISRDLYQGGLITEIDVTSTIREWVLGRDNNHGFVLSGGNETFQPARDTCQSKVINAQLVLVPFKKLTATAIEAEADKKLPEEVVLDGEKTEFNYRGLRN